MRALILLVAILLVVGCGKSLETMVVGTYEITDRGDTVRLVFLDNGAVEKYNLTVLLSDFLKPMAKYKWSIKEGEVHIKDEHGGGGVCRINPDGGLTPIAGVRNGKRTNLPKDAQKTLKKIK